MKRFTVTIRESHPSVRVFEVSVKANDTDHAVKRAFEALAKRRIVPKQHFVPQAVH